METRARRASSRFSARKSSVTVTERVTTTYEEPTPSCSYSSTPGPANLQKAFVFVLTANNDLLKSPPVTLEPQPRNFICEVCDGAFNSEEKVRQHRNLGCGTASPYKEQVYGPLPQHNRVVCKICKDQFTTRYNMLRHMKYQHGSMEKKVEPNAKTVPPTPASLKKVMTKEKKSKEEKKLKTMKKVASKFSVKSVGGQAQYKLLSSSPPSPPPPENSEVEVVHTQIGKLAGTVVAEGTKSKKKCPSRKGTPKKTVSFKLNAVPVGVNLNNETEVTATPTKSIAGGADSAKGKRKKPNNLKNRAWKTASTIHIGVEVATQTSSSSNVTESNQLAIHGLLLEQPWATQETELNLIMESRNSSSATPVAVATQTSSVAELTGERAEEMEIELQNNAEVSGGYTSSTTPAPVTVATQTSVAELTEERVDEMGIELQNKAEVSGGHASSSSTPPTPVAVATQTSSFAELTGERAEEMGIELQNKAKVSGGHTSVTTPTPVAVATQTSVAELTGERADEMGIELQNKAEVSVGDEFFDSQADIIMQIDELDEIANKRVQQVAAEEGDETMNDGNGDNETLETEDDEEMERGASKDRANCRIM